MAGLMTLVLLLANVIGSAGHSVDHEQHHGKHRQFSVHDNALASRSNADAMTTDANAMTAADALNGDAIDGHPAHGQATGEHARCLDCACCGGIAILAMATTRISAFKIAGLPIRESQLLAGTGPVTPDRPPIHLVAA